MQGTQHSSETTPAGPPFRRDIRQRSAVQVGTRHDGGTVDVAIHPWAKRRVEAAASSLFAEDTIDANHVEAAPPVVAYGEGTPVSSAGIEIS